MKKVILIVFAFVLHLCLAAQPKEVSLVVIGEGPTKEEATNNALRSAVEQAFGVFVSANTEILNDEVVKDEIATISSGNIKSYKLIAYEETTTGEKSVTLQATVSIGKLISYAQNHGSSTEFAGGTFAANMRLLELNRNATKKALEKLYQVLPSMVSSMYDYKLDVKDPIIHGNYCEIETVVKVLANRHTKEVGDFYFQSLKALALSETDLRNNSDGTPYYAYYFHSFGNSVLSNNLKLGSISQSKAIPSRPQLRPDRVKTGGASAYNQTYSIKKPSYFYFPINNNLINRIFYSSIFSYEISDNLGNNYIVPSQQPELYDHVSIPATRGGSGIGVEANFDRISPHHILLSGLYSIESSHDVSAPNTLGIVNGSLINNSVLLGIITTNTNHSPGKVIYSFSDKIVISLDRLKEIKSFSISPTHE